MKNFWNRYELALYDMHCMIVPDVHQRALYDVHQGKNGGATKYIFLLFFQLHKSFGVNRDAPFCIWRVLASFSNLNG